MNFIKVIYQYRILSISLLFFFSNNLKSQVSIREFTEDLKTYDFSDQINSIFISNSKFILISLLMDIVLNQNQKNSK